MAKPARRRNTNAAESHRLSRAHAEIDRLTDELAAHQARAGSARVEPLLIDVARVLREAEELADPMTTTSPSTDVITRPRPASKPPKGALTPQRRAARILRENLQGAINKWDNAVRRLDDPDTPRPETTDERRPQTVRCRRTGCPSRGKSVPWLELRPDESGVVKAVIVWDCRACGSPYPAHPARRMDA